MNKELMKKSGLIIILICFILLLFNALYPKPNSKQSIASRLIDQNSVLATGIIFDTGKSIAFDPLTEKEISPCNKTANTIKQRKVKTKHGCKVNEFKIDAPAAVLDAIKNSRQIYKGFVTRDGKKIPTTFVSTVTALYEGSLCHTYWSGGVQLENCISVKQICNYYVNRQERINGVLGLRQTCTNLSSSWPNQPIP
jgi:hypothetical protein